MRGQVRIYQEKIVARRRKELLYRTLIVAGILIVVVSSLSLLSRADSFKVASVEVSGTGVLAEGTVASMVHDRISGNYLGIFSRSNSLIYPKDAVASVVASLPPVKSVEVKRKDLRSLAIDVVEREKEFIWCTAEEGLEACYMLDYDGFVFAKAQNVSSSDFVYRGALPVEPLGKYALPIDEFRKIRFFLEELEGLSVGTREAAISETGYMTIYLDRGGKIVVDTKDDLSVILGNIAAVITDKAVAPSLPEFLDRLDYIKLDSGNKVVYKMK